MEYINNNMFWYVRTKVIFFILKDICNKNTYNDKELTWKLK